ncbi:MAG: hypothetical protein BWZ02_01932 [Lentisphaerae bacterium ADurb.BinA184]|nr:MAG: hypothetical protein BWZ02_01932 [Lentisphaerae bacterium ADurb.BinA184]
MPLRAPGSIARLIPAAAALAATALAAPELRLALPLGRTAYQTNEWIDVTVVRSDAAPLPAGTLAVTLTGTDGSRIALAFPAAEVAAVDGQARAVEHLRLDGRLLRPGAYTLEAACNGASAQTAIELFSHLRRSTFRLIDWGSRAGGADLAKLGEDGLGFNLIYGDYRLGRHLAHAEATLRGGADFMQYCTMSGAHQMDLRQECDWSDPYVIRGGTARAVQQAFLTRTVANTAGVHFYDEPGLTWWTHPRTGAAVPHNIPAQDRAFLGAFGRPPLQYSDVRADDPGPAAAWNHWARWKLSFMDAAWKDARFGVETVAPALISCTQSVYGFTAYADGYYFNVVRSLPVISGHGGYNDGPASYFYPSFHHEFGRMRDLAKPNWYLPAWYGGMSSANFRLEQYLSFMTNLQGMAKPPDMQVHKPAECSDADGIVESNKAMARLGTIFTTLAPARGEVALLYSISQCIGSQLRDMNDNYEAQGHTRGKLLQAYLAGKQLHIPFDPIVEEDIVDGTLAANHRAVILAGVNYLAPGVTAALEAYAAGGGAVLLTADSQAVIKGAVKLDVPASAAQYQKISDLWKTDQKESMRQRAAGLFMTDAAPLAAALKAQFDRLGIRPVVICDRADIVATRQGDADIEYLFAVNAAWDEKDGGPQAIKPVTATLALPGGAGRPVYDALRGGLAAEFGNADKNPVAELRFGPGQMRVFARTAAPVAAVRVTRPALVRDSTAAGDPIRVECNAMLVDSAGGVLGGSAPLRVRLLDPQGDVRYDLYRATGKGVCPIRLPLAANDPAGTWRIEVTELLANTSGSASFAYTPAPQCGAVAGTLARAVCFGDDRDRIYRFIRRHDRVTLVTGTSEFDAAAAKHLAAALAPWGVRCTAVSADDVNRPRSLTEEEAKTWVGLEFGRAELGDKNRPGKAGFALEGPAILIGNPADNPLIKAVAQMGFLPYTCGPDLPGPGRGAIAWQRDAIGIGQESITLIAYDAAGMTEAAGTLYEAAAGLDPLTPTVGPLAAGVTPVVAPPEPAARVSEPAIVWQAILPDRAAWMKVGADGTLTLYTLDGSLITLDTQGKVTARKAIALADAGEAPKTELALPEAVAAKLPAHRIVKFAVADGRGLTAVGCWGGELRIFAADGSLRAQAHILHDFNGLVWAGQRLAAATSDGRVVAFEIRP